MSAASRSRWPSRLDRPLRWSAGAAILVVVLAQVGGGPVLDQLVRADLAIAIPAIAGLVAVHLLGAATWRLLQSRISGWAPDWPAAFRIYYVAQAIGGMTPANLGSDLYRLTAVRQERRWSDAAVPIVTQRIGSSAALALLGVIGLSVISVQVPAAGWLVGGALSIVLLGCGAVVLLRWRPAAERLGGAGTVRSWAGSALASVWLGGLFHLVSLLLALALVTSLSPVADPMPVLAALSVARLSLLVPVAPSGLGVQEGLLVVLFAGVGLSGEVALAASLLGRVALLATTLLGAGLLVRGRSSGVLPVGPPAGRDALPG